MLMKLRTRLLAIIVTTLAVLVTVYMVYIIPEFESRVTDELIDELEVQTKHIDFYLEEFISNTKDDIAFLLTDHTIYTENSDDFTNYLDVQGKGIQFSPGIEEQAIIELFNHFLEAKPQIDYLYVARENGSFVMNVPLQSLETPIENLFNFDPRERPWYQEAIEAEGELILTDPYVAPAGYAFFLTAASRFTDTNGDTLGVLGIDLNIVELTKYLVNVRSKEPGIMSLIQDETMITVLPEGEVVLNPLTQEFEVQIETIVASGNRYAVIDDAIHYVYKSEVLPWTFHVQIPMDYFKQNVVERISIFVWSMGLLLIIAMGMWIIFVQRAIIKPIQILTHTTTEISDTGNLNKLVHIKSKDEIGKLGLAFNQMITDLKDHQNNLEKKVDERTRELSRLNFAVEQSPLSIVITDLEGNIEYANKQLLETTGYTEEEVLGQTPRLFKSGLHDSTVYKDLWETIKDGRIWEGEITNKTKQGALIWEHCMIGPVFDDDGSIVNYIGMRNNVTQAKQLLDELEDNKHFMNALVDNSPTIIYVKDVEGRYILVNKLWTDIFGFTKDEVEGKTTNEVMGSDEYTFIEHDHEVIRTKRPIQVNDTIVIEGIQRDFVEMKFPIMDVKGGIQAICGIATDITEFNQIQKEIQKNEEKLRFSLQSMGAYYWVDDLFEETVKYSSNQFYKQYGYADEEIPNTIEEFFSLMHPDDVVETMKKFQAHIKNPDSEYMVEFRLLKKNGDYAWNQSIGRAIEWDENEKVSKVAGLTMDISDRKQDEFDLIEAKVTAEKLSRDYKNFLESTSDLVYLKDECLRYIACSKPLTQLLGYDDWTDVVGKTEEEVQMKESKIKFHKEPELKVLNNGEVLEITEDIITVGDEKGWVNTIKKPLMNSKNEIVGVLSISRDVTDIVRMNDELKSAKEIAESATRAKSDFLANMSHEIRTPMNAVIGLGGLLERTKLDIKQHDYVEKINNSAKNLLGIINDILDFSKIEAGKLDIEKIPFKVDDVLGNLSSVISMKAFEKGIEFAILKEANIAEQLIGDPLRLNQILLNLSNNAIKFTDEGEVVLNIEMVSSKAKEVKLKFVIKDTGIGMTEEQVGRLFKAFTQADTSITRKYGGTGLGLTISKKLIDMMKGNISVESEYGKGTSFIFEMPFEVVEAQEERMSIIPESIKDLKIAVIDDNETARIVYQNYLKVMPKEVQYYNSGETFLKDWKPGKFDLLFMDYRMPGLDGIETWMKVKNEESEQKLPKIIMVTAYGKEKVIKEATDAGIQSILMKPVTHSTLFDTLLQTVNNDEWGVVKRNRKEADRLIVAPHLEGVKILLVEDNLINQQVASEYLEDLGISIAIANHGKEALDKVLKEMNEYDLVLMDLQMPVMDGMTASREIRKKISSDVLPIIALSADVMVETVRNIYEAGMQDHVAKPINLEELLKSIGKVLGRDEIELKSQNHEEESDERIILVNHFKSLNVEKALRNMGGNVSIYKKVLSRFLEDYKEFSTQVEHYLNSANGEEGIRYFHTLKGLAGSIGQEEIFKAAQIIESDLNQNKIQNRAVVQSEAFDNLAIQLEYTINELKNLEIDMKEVHSSASEILNASAFNDKLKTLKEFMESYDTDAEELLIELKTNFEQRDIEEQWKKLYNYISEYEYEAGIDLLITIIKN